MEHFIIIAEYEFTQPRIVTRPNIKDALEWFEFEKNDMEFINRISLYRVSEFGTYYIVKTYTVKDGEKTFD